MDILDRLDRARDAVNVLEHPFYERWSAGRLRAGELSSYAREYRHAVLALAQASTQAAEEAPAEHQSALLGHASEEAAHVELWDRFVQATGARADAPGHAPLVETDLCVRAWVAGEDLLEHLAVLYVIEAGQPEIARTKLRGLSDHYGYAPEGPATEYFRVHKRLDVEHARQARELISSLMVDAESVGGHAGRMVMRADAALRGNWLLLDGVEASEHGQT